MHAARVLSLKRKRSLEQRRRQLHRGLTNGDLSRSGDEDIQNDIDSTPWYVDKWVERRNAFQSAKNSRGLTLFHMFALVGIIGVVLMIGSLFTGPATGLLEFGFSALLFSIFCLVFVRCDGGVEPPDKEHELGENNDHTGIVMELEPLDAKANESSEDEDESIKRSAPRKIPSPLRVFGYALNFSPIPECSEPGSCASSFLTRNNSSAGSKLAGESLSRVSSKGGGLGGGGFPITESHEEEEEFDYDRLQLKIDDLLQPEEGWTNFASHEDDPINTDPIEPEVLGSNSNLSADYSASFDTDDSITADLSAVTVIERSGPGSDDSSPKTPTP